MLRQLIHLFSLIFCLILFMQSPAFAAPSAEWAKVLEKAEKENSLQKQNGWSHVISGSLVGVGGLIGSSITEDPLEKGLYSVFQTIGIASIGYGFYLSRVDDEDTLLLKTIQSSSITSDQKFSLWKAYRERKAVRSKREDSVRAITHGLIAGINFLNASQQKQAGIRNSLLFIGGANVLAAISYSFSFD